MNRKEFLAQLARLLWDIPEADRKDALEYYENYFEDAGVENESSVIQELGSPGKVAAIIKTDLEGGQDGSGEKEYGTYTENGYTDARFEERDMPQSRTAENNWEKNRYHGSEKEENAAYHGPYENHAGVGRSKQPRGGLSWALILVLLILTSPVWAGLGLGLLGVLLGLAGACLGVLVALVLSGVGLVVGGIVLFLNALFYQMATPATAVVTIGGSMIMTAVGLLLVWLFFLLILKVFPPCFRGIVNFIQRILFKGRTGGDRA